MLYTQLRNFIFDRLRNNLCKRIIPINNILLFRDCGDLASGVPSGQLFFHFLGGNRFREQISLDDLAPLFAQNVEMPLVIDALGQNGKVQRLAHGDRRVDDGVSVVLVDIQNKGTVDLYLFYRERFQHA